MDKTYQREEIGDYGFAAKAVPEYSETRQETFKGCLHRIGTKRLPIRAQSVVPSTMLFKVNCGKKWKTGLRLLILLDAIIFVDEAYNYHFIVCGDLTEILKLASYK